MIHTTIHLDDNFRVVSGFNGGTYEIINLKNNKSVYLQFGDDAANFRKDFDMCFTVEHFNNLCSQYFY